MYPEQYIQFLVHFNGDRDYFECHELLEEFWKDSADQKKDSVWVGFILLAVSRYHHRRGNIIGAKRTLEKAIKILSSSEEVISKLGLDVGVLFPLLSKLLIEIENGDSYQSMDLPVTEPLLLKTCMKECENRGFRWGQKSNIMNESLVHRHKLRDRTMVINERLEALRVKKGNE